MRPLALVGLVTVALAGPAGAQTLVPPEARALVVKLSTTFADSSEDFGAGIIVGRSGDTLYIATARHVVMRGEGFAADIQVLFGDSTRAVARGHRAARGSFDLALVVVTGADGAVPAAPPLDRLGDQRALRFGEGVRAIGCRAGVCWLMPGAADPVVGIDGRGISIQTSFVGPGSSGGALFNAWWEVVGLVVEDQPPVALALGIDQVLAALRGWEVPVGLVRRSRPRAGYRQSVGGALFTSTPAPFTRAPAGRLTYQRRTATAFGWHVGLLRLAPRDVAANAVVGGIALAWRRDAVTVRPFVELGTGNVEGRHDQGGYDVIAGADTVYVPVWRRVQGNSFGVGFGVAVEAVVRPPLVAELVLGRWSFGTPEPLPRLSRTTVGLGLRVGR